MLRRDRDPEPMHENPEASWFDTTGRVMAEPAG